MKKRERRIIFLMSKLTFKPKVKLPLRDLREAKLKILLKNKKIELEIFIGVSPKSKEHKERKEVFNFQYSKGLNDEQIKDLWIKTYNHHKSDKKYRLMPKPERRDNQNPKTNTKNYGSGGGNKGWLRVPSKKHKNRYKNFLKLFPWFKEN